MHPWDCWDSLVFMLTLRKGVSHCTKTAKMLDTQKCLQNHIKNAKANKFLSTLSKEGPTEFYLSTTFGLSFMISSVAPTRSSTSLYACLITKIGNRNLQCVPLCRNLKCGIRLLKGILHLTLYFLYIRIKKIITHLAGQTYVWHGCKWNFAGPQIYLQPAKIKSQHFGVSLKFWFVIESIAYDD